MKWKVELRNISGDRRLLADVLSKLSITLIGDNQDTYFTGTVLDRLETPSDVRKYASRLQLIVHHASTYEPRINLGFKIGCIMETMPCGPDKQHYFLKIRDAVHTQYVTRAALTVTPDESISVEERQLMKEQCAEREYQERRLIAANRIVSAAIDNRAYTAQRLLAGDLLPLSLGHIADLIKDDLGSRITDLASNNEWKRFYRSINHPDVFGENARHIVSKDDPPPNPMTLSEARNFIHRVTEKWLAAKTASMGV
ncbi:hypothetical protein [Thauera sp.]|uniref:hypothetical protein n=1 Tax=Thauera sp. TaxID=1905334 RepID=UPI0039E54C64